MVQLEMERVQVQEEEDGDDDDDGLFINVQTVDWNENPF